MSTSEPNERSAIAQAPISVILLSSALSTETQDAWLAWRRYLGTLGRPYEIIVIQELRPEVAPSTEEANSHPSATPRTICYDRAIGYRDAFNEAIHTAKYPLLAFCSCDLQYHPQDLDRMLKIIDLVDLVLGYRAGGPVPFWRSLYGTILMVLSRVLIGLPLEPTVCWLGAEGLGRRWVARWIFGLRVLDPECPFRLARREIFDRIPIQSGGPFVQVEMLAKANHLTCLIAEEAIEWVRSPLPNSNVISFADDAWLVFSHPQFTRGVRS